MYSWLMRTVGLVLLITLPAAAGAQPLPPVAGDPILVVSGKIANTNAGDTARFDLAGLEKIGKTVVKTTTKWTEGEIAFEGVLMRDLLKAVGASGTEIVAIALNDYKVKIPVSDFQSLNVILAYRRDGRTMPVRDKGPLWIMYPFADNPEIKTDMYFARCAWQVKAIEVR